MFKRRIFSIGTAITISFFVMYFGFGVAIASTKVFKVKDSFFNADPIRVIFDITLQNQTLTGGSFKHPLFVIFFNPIGSFLRKIILFILNTSISFNLIPQKFDQIVKSIASGASGESGLNLISATIAALLLTSLFGALCVGLAFIFFLALKMSRFQASLFSILFGLCSAQLIWGSVPETFIFASSSIILIFIILAKFPEKTYLFILAGVYSFGITSTNLFQAIITYVFSLRPKTSLKKLIIKTFLLVVSILVIAFCLSFLQQNIYPTSKPFFFLDNYQQEKQYMPLYQNSNKLFVIVLVERTMLLFQYFVVYNIILPKTIVQKNYVNINLDEILFSRFYPTGFFAVVIFILLLIWSLRNMIKFQLLTNSIVKCLLLCLIFNFLLHVFYGDNLFLYTPHWTFQIIALLAITLQPSLQNQKSSILLTTLLLILISSQFANSFIWLKNFYFQMLQSS